MICGIFRELDLINSKNNFYFSLSVYKIVENKLYLNQLPNKIWFYISAV